MPLYIELMGGLANIAFQVANGIAVSKEYNIPVQFSNYTKGITKRKQEHIWMKTIFKELYYFKGKVKINKIIKEKGFNYKPINLKNVNKNLNIMLFGYYQSEKYFKKYKNYIIDLFMKCYKQDKILNSSLNNIITDNNLNNVCTIHIRRADYLKLQHFHVVQSLDYYKNAMKKMNEKYNDLTFVVFSDDVNWCKKQQIFKNNNTLFAQDLIHANKNKHLINNYFDDVLELYLMSMFQYHIIANSTFSWLGSYLGYHKYHKLDIIAPKKWFNPNGGCKNWDSIYHDDMTIL